MNEKGDVPKGYENQCAIKVSAALVAAGFELKNFSGATVRVDGKAHAIRAAELANWITPARIDGITIPPRAITGKDWQDKIKGSTGIVYYENYWQREGERTPTGDHIDLWNGSRLTASDLEAALVTFARFSLGINSIDRIFSNLGGSTRILFWDVA